MSAVIDLLDVERAARGDRGAFGRLLERTRALVTSIALATLRDVPASEDVAQDVFVAVWRDLRTLRNPESFLPWLRQLTRHRSLDAVRGAGRRAARPAAGDPERVLGQLADPRPGVVEARISAEERAALEEALEELPADGRELLTLFYREGHSVAQVAALLDLREAAVKKRLQRARDTVRRLTLEKLGELLERTAPGAAFTAAVVAGLAAPLTATAATLGAGKAAGGAGLGAAAGASGLGAALGVAGVVASVGLVSRHARDERERQALRRFTRLHAVLVALAAVALPVAGLLGGGVALVATFAAVYGATAYGYLVTLPRLCRLSGPPSAETERALRIARLLIVAGGVGGGATVVWMATILS